MTDITTRPAVERDRAAVEEIAQEALSALRTSPSVARWGSAMRRNFVEHWFPPLGSPHSATTMIVAEQDGYIVGVGSTRPGRRHPHALMRLAVRIHARRQGVGTALYSALVAAAPGPFVAREMLADPATIEFFTTHGFVTGERTREGTIDPGAAETIAWVEATRAAQSSRIRTEHPSGPAAEFAAARAADRLYGWIHPWSRPLPLPDDELLDTYLRTVRTDGLITVWLDDEIAGVAMLTESPFGVPAKFAHLAVCGVVDPDISHAATITRALVAGSLDVAQRRGWTVEIEVNEPNRYLWECVTEIPGANLFSDMTLLVSRFGA